ncbi:10642_t:CDS:2 [Paraglomus occultum]|uniref:Tetratricopeptide repeat and J domain-containing co-chaperone DNJ1 n=1 Tax=Paraglomus occultum TaxID=144539 RepID=A0A9N9C711_9GLOM|nr:10642_t:CDS:2 [Paraglomus occultum]
MKVRKLAFTLIAVVLPGLPTILGDTTQQYLDEASNFRREGAYKEALESYNVAISKDPQNYLSYFGRAVTYLSLSRSVAALEDFTKILELKPDFDQARLHRAKIYIKEGSLKEARRDLKEYLTKNANDAEAKKLLIDIGEAEKAISSAETELAAKKYDDCITHATVAVKICPQSFQLRLIRANCHLAKHEIEDGIRDLSQASALNPSDLSLLVRLAKLNYFVLYNPTESKAFIKQCLQSDPDNKVCRNLHKTMKKLEKDLEMINNDITGHRWQAAINKIKGKNGNQGFLSQIEEEAKSIPEAKSGKVLVAKLYRHMCIAYAELKQADLAIKWCTSTLKLSEDDVEALLSRAEAYILNDDFDSASADFSKAFDASGGTDQRAAQGFQRANKLRQNAKKKDYYKILGVSRLATKKEIKKAFRKLAQEWHPDKYKGDLSQDEVATKMSAINEAYEVLSNDELRERYDNGDDPNDPGGSSGGPFYSSGSPFMQFGGAKFSGFPFSSGDDGNFQFTFRFP